MEGDRIWSIITLALCCVVLYFSISSSRQIKSLHEENIVLLEKVDSLQRALSSPSESSDVVPATTSAPSLIDEIMTDLGNEYRAAKKAGKTTSAKIVVSSTYRLEDRYVSFRVHEPEYMGNEEGRITLNITVKRNGDVVTAKVKDLMGITDAETIESAKKAALQTDFNYMHEAPERQLGIITYTYTRKKN